MLSRGERKGEIAQDCERDLDFGYTFGDAVEVHQRRCRERLLHTN
jgi:hypothetical protein